MLKLSSTDLSSYQLIWIVGGIEYIKDLLMLCVDTQTIARWRLSREEIKAQVAAMEVSYFTFLRCFHYHSPLTRLPDSPAGGRGGCGKQVCGHLR